MKKINVLMCGSHLSVRGGMVSVLKNYLGYNNWGCFNICFVPTHVEKNNLVIMTYFMFSYFRILILALFRKIHIAYFHTSERGSFFRKSILVRTLNKFGIKTVMHHHGAEFELFYSNLSPPQKSYVQKTLEIVDLNIVLSNRLITMIKEKAPKANVKVLYNAVKTYDSNPYKLDAKNILFLGRMGERKGIYDLLLALKNIDEKLCEDVGVFLCGDGDIATVKETIREYKIEHRIRHIGWISENEKKSILKKTIVNVLPSYNEGLPMAILETMAYGIPNISTCIASIPEVIQDGKSGYLIQPGEIARLEGLILLIVNDRDRREEVSRKSWNEINSQFSLDAHMEKLKEYLNELVEIN